jgi:hypothetical protein
MVMLVQLDAWSVKGAVVMGLAVTRTVSHAKVEQVY